MEPRPFELAAAIRAFKPTGPAPGGKTWDALANQQQLDNLVRLFGDNLGKVVAALWGPSDMPTAGQAAAIFASHSNDPQGTVAKLLRLAEEERPKAPQGGSGGIEGYESLFEEETP